MRRVITLGVLGLFSLAAPIIFQNCSQPAEGVGQSSFQSFALDSKLDTISYMSCSDMSAADPLAYYTFKAGAYESGGMRLSSEFYKAASRMSSSRAMTFLANGTQHGDVQLQMSVRRSSDMVIFKKKEEPELNSDYANIFPPINTEDLLGELVNLPDNNGARGISSVDGVGRVQSLSGTYESLSKFEGSLSFTDNAFLEESVRSEIRKGALLALTYAQLSQERGQDTIAMSPADFAADPRATDFNFVFGTGYRLNFQQGSPAAGHPARVIGSIDEINLENKSNSNTRWSCPAAMRFKIVRPEDVGALDSGGKRVTNCERVLDPDVMSKEEAVVRRVLRTEHWWIDMKNKCAIPKPGVVGFCYGESLDIEYNDGPCGTDKACTHFVSVCTANPNF